MTGWKLALLCIGACALLSCASTLPPCNWTMRRGNLMRSASCSTDRPLSAFKMEKGYSHPLCSMTYNDPRCPVQCLSLTNPMYTSDSLAISGDTIMVEVTVDGSTASTGAYLVRSAAILLSYNGSVIEKKDTWPYFNDFGWSGIVIGIPFMDNHGRLVWWRAWVQTENDYLTVVVPVNDPENPLDVWTISSFYPKYHFATAGAIIGDTVVYADSTVYPAYFATPRVANISSSTVLYSASSTVPFGDSSEFSKISVHGRDLLLFVSLSPYAVIAFSMDLSVQLYYFQLPWISNGWRMTAVDESLGILYGWSYGYAGGNPSEVFAVDLASGTLKWNSTFEPNDWNGVESLIVSPGLGVLATSAAIDYAPGPKNMIRMFSATNGLILYTLQSLDFAWVGAAIGLSHNIFAIPKLGVGTHPQSPYIDIIDGKTGTSLQTCPGLSDSIMSLAAVETSDGYTVFLYTHLGYLDSNKVPTLAAVSCLVKQG